MGRPQAQAFHPSTAAQVSSAHSAGFRSASGGTRWLYVMRACQHNFELPFHVSNSGRLLALGVGPLAASAW